MNKIHVSQPLDGVTLIEIDAPPANPLSLEMRLAFEAELDRIAGDDSQRALVVTGKGEHFSAGDNLIDAFRRGEDSLSSLKQFGALLDKIEALRVPVIAAINGAAVGGGLELALCCDIRIGSDRASFIGAGVNVGLMASVFRLPRLIGTGPAKSMLLTGLPVGAQDALRFGLLTAVHSPETLMDEALRLAKRIATRAPLSVEATKRQCARAFDIETADAMEAAIAELDVLARSQDHKSALAAFAQKQTPKFSRC